MWPGLNVVLACWHSMTDVNIVFGDFNIANISELDDMVTHIFARVFCYPMNFPMKVVFLLVLLEVIDLINCSHQVFVHFVDMLVCFTCVNNATSPEVKTP